MRKFITSKSKDRQNRIQKTLLQPTSNSRCDWRQSTSSSITTSTTTTTSTTSLTTTTRATSKSSELGDWLPSFAEGTCGLSLNLFNVIGGETAARGEFPFLVLLGYW